MNRERLVPALIVATALGIGLLVLQRWVAETKTAAIVLVSIWFAIVGIAALVATSRRPELRAPVLGTFAAILVATVAIGYWTGFRDTRSTRTWSSRPPRRVARSATRRSRVTAKPQSQRTPPRKIRSRSPRSPPARSRSPWASSPARTATPAPATATVVKETSGERTLTFTDFDVDPGVEVEVWLTQDESSFDDRVELGGLKGNVGDQQYELPEDADLTRYDTVVLYCTPFTVRIAVAPLS